MKATLNVLQLIKKQEQKQNQQQKQTQKQSKVGRLWVLCV